MAHPDGLLVRRALEQARRRHARNRRRAVLTCLRVPDHATEVDGHDLLTVAEPEYGNAQLEHARIDIRRIIRVDARRTTRQDERRGVLGGQLGCWDIAGDDLGIDAQVAHPARDELAVLGPEIQHENGLRTC